MGKAKIKSIMLVDSLTYTWRITLHFPECSNLPNILYDHSFQKLMSIFSFIKVSENNILWIQIGFN